MANQAKPSPTLLLKKKPTELVKPTKQTSWGTLFLSTLDNDPINEVMYAALYVFKANEKNQNDPVSLLRKALSELLVYYYPLSSKMTRRKSDRKLQLTNHSEGVPFVIATATCDLATLNYIENIDEEIALRLVPEIELNYQYEISYHPLAFQVTKFPCGGFTIGVALSHAVSDGFGVATIIHALTELAGGKSKPSVMPVWERERLDRGIDNKPARVPGSDTDGLLATSPYIPTDDMVTETITIRPEVIKKLRDTLAREDEFLNKEGVTTFEVLSAFMWKSRSRALYLNRDGITVLGFAVGIRHVLDPPLPKGYYGNSYIDVYIKLTVRKLDESSISDIVKLVKRAKKSAYDKKYVEEELRNIERLLKEDAKFEGIRDSLLFLTDMRNIGYFESVDFGWKEPVHVRPLTPPEFAKNLGMILRPSKVDPSMEGGVKVMMTLPRDAMVNFKQEMHICVSDI
ncbi:hypothetical protein Bca4012_054348 [Brassica carinata]|uniref:Uncharacterized protein n=1 Tax=Brassica carinata TaxID=52824 RepID=A0A8X7VXR6_BRACI|nr:hypothetical protein Bca52824_012619 [Brassica carinata]